MYIHLITSNLGNFFIYLSAFLVSLCVNCSVSHGGFLSFFLFTLRSSSYIPGQLQKTLKMAVVFVYSGVSFTEQKFLILM